VGRVTRGLLENFESLWGKLKALGVSFLVLPLLFYRGAFKRGGKKEKNAVGKDRGGDRPQIIFGVEEKQ